MEKSLEHVTVYRSDAVEPPSVAGVVTVRSHGLLEFRLVARVS